VEGGTFPREPGAFTVSVQQRRDSVFVTWTGATGASSYRIELRATADTLRKTAGPADTLVVFTPADGLVDDMTYVAHAFAASGGGETPATSTPSIVTDFFPWDEYFDTALHATGQGKQTFYDSVPNRGFERFTQIAYEDLSCKNCHLPSSTGGCSSCHTTDTPELGADVDASLTGVCGSCHSRQVAETRAPTGAPRYSDVHRDAGMDCMTCHTLGDVHGDGTAYASMLVDGAIDPTCEDCHSTIASNAYHTNHANTVDCTACHTQSVITCYNCHFETEVEKDFKKAYGQFTNWRFLLNRNGKVYTGNFQSVKYGTSTFIGMAPFYAHTIARNAVTGCDDCHGNAAVTDWFADSVMDVVTWNGTALTHQTGVIPVPPNFNLGGMRFDFVDLDSAGGSVWSFLKSGADSIQLLYGTPLTLEQMNKIK
jgi:predicted CXXCH cytochrome family protein